MSTKTLTRSSLDNVESNAHLDKAKDVIEKLNSTPLSIVQAKSNFEKKINEFNEVEPATAFTPRQLPSHIANEVAAQIVGKTCVYILMLKVNFTFL